MSLENAARETGRKDMILGCTEGHFSTLDDAGKCSEKRKKKSRNK